MNYFASLAASPDLTKSSVNLPPSNSDSISCDDERSESVNELDEPKHPRFAPRISYLVEISSAKLRRQIPVMAVEESIILDSRHVKLCAVKVLNNIPPSLNIAKPAFALHR